MGDIDGGRPDNVDAVLVAAPSSAAEGPPRGSSCSSPMGRGQHPGDNCLRCPLCYSIQGSRASMSQGGGPNKKGWGCRSSHEMTEDSLLPPFEVLDDPEYQSSVSRLSDLIMDQPQHPPLERRSGGWSTS